MAQSHDQAKLIWSKRHWLRAFMPDAGASGVMTLT
jgi:hypothetical protein